MDVRNEVAAVFRFARRAGRGGDDFVDFVRFGEPLEFRKCRQRCSGGRLCQPPTVETAGTEANHVLLAIDHLEGEVRTDLHHDHVNRVGADVYCG